MASRVELLPAESVAYDARPHLLFFAFPAAWGSLLLPLVFAHTAASGFIADALRILLVGFSLVWLPWAAWHFIQWWFTRCMVTNFRVVRRHGVLSREGVEIPLDRVSNVNFHQSILERLFGAGDLIIESSGQDGQSRFSDIRHPDEVQLLIHRQILTGKQKTSPPYPGSSPTAPDLLGQLQELESMRFRGSLSDAEFVAAKQKLLGNGS